MDIETKSKIYSKTIEDMLFNYPTNSVYDIAREIVTLVINKDSENKEDYYMGIMGGVYYSLAIQYNACLKNVKTSKRLINNMIKHMYELRSYTNQTMVSDTTLDTIRDDNMFKIYILEYINKTCVNCDIGFEQVIKAMLAQGIIIGVTIFNTHNSRGNGHSGYWLDVTKELGNRIENKQLRYTPLTVKEILREDSL